MRLMREIEVPQRPGDLVFRASRVHAVLFVLICVGACAAMIGYRWPGPRAAYYVSGVLLFFLWLGRRFVLNRFHPSNWLVRAADDGLFLHLRSYLNDRMPTEDPTVMFLAYSEMRSARPVREWVTTPDLNGRSQSQIIHYVELELAGDPKAVADVLADERARPAMPERHWYGSSTTVFCDYPVLMESPPFLRLRWQVVPRASALLDRLRRQVQIAEPIKLGVNFTNLGGLSRAEQEKRLRDLDHRGETIAAVYLARRLYGLDLGGASDFVKGLQGDRSQ